MKNLKLLKVLCIFGTRPEAIKMAPILRELARRRERFALKICVTAQHRQMLDQILDLFGIVPDYDLNVMEDNQFPAQVLAAVVKKLGPVMEAEKPDWVLVQGDTATVAAASLAAFYARVKVGHVEAGLRTHDKWQPFPEEINRRVAGVIADLHFAPTDWARQNLLREGVPDEQIIVTGNPVIDALKWVTKMPPDAETAALLQNLGLNEETIANARHQNVPCRWKSKSLSLDDSRLILVTAHRRENFGRPLRNICIALQDIAAQYDGRVMIVYPVHLNPDVSEPVHAQLGDVPNITLTPPLSYLSLAHLLKQSYLVLTDSGGIQEEAPTLGVPVLVLRGTTERPEAVEAGTVRIVGTDRERIVVEAARLLDDPEAYGQMARAINPYGDGRAAERIAEAVRGEPVTAFKRGGGPQNLLSRI